MVKFYCLCFAAFLCLSVQLAAQQVSTLVSNHELRDGLHVDSTGNIYISSGGFAGFNIGRYDIQSETLDVNFARGFFGPVDVDQYRDSLLVVSNYDNNTVSTHNLNSGQHTVIARGLDGPSGIAIDASDNIYVASWGNAPAFAGRQIHKISPSGEVSQYINSSTLYRPQAMAVGLDDVLVVHSNQRLYRVNAADSTLQFWTNIGTTVGHMVFRQRDSCIYATASSRVLKIKPDGTWQTFAGLSPGYQDGALESARFKALLGIHFSPDENILYVCDSGYGENIGRLRRIVMEMPVNNMPIIESRAVNLFPNPAQQYFTLEQPTEQLMSVDIYDASGQLVLTHIINAPTTTFDISSFPTGTYNLILNYPDGIQMKKMVKQ